MEINRYLTALTALKEPFRTIKKIHPNSVIYEKAEHLFVAIETLSNCFDEMKTAFINSLFTMQM